MDIIGKSVAILFVFGLHQILISNTGFLIRKNILEPNSKEKLENYFWAAISSILVIIGIAIITLLVVSSKQYIFAAYYILLIADLIIIFTTDKEIVRETKKDIGWEFAPYLNFPTRLLRLFFAPIWAIAMAFLIIAIIAVVGKVIG